MPVRRFHSVLTLSQEACRSYSISIYSSVGNKPMRLQCTPMYRTLALQAMAPYMVIHRIVDTISGIAMCQSICNAARPERILCAATWQDSPPRWLLLQQCAAAPLTSCERLPIRSAGGAQLEQLLEHLQEQPQEWCRARAQTYPCPCWMDRRACRLVSGARHLHNTANCPSVLLAARPKHAVTIFGLISCLIIKILAPVADEIYCCQQGGLTTACRSGNNANITSGRASA